MAFKVFVSYSSHDLEHVEQLQQQLSDSPVEVFVAENSVAPSQELGSTISQAIEQCDLFILVWSKNAQESAWVSQEVGRAGALKKKILPLVLTEGMQLPGFIQNLKYLSVHKEPEKALAQARQIVVGAYEEKVKLESAHAQAEKDKLALLAIGALLFWAFSK
ncbi:toll/interleukin-1 receptor domain-containing protein [Gallionella capsiferriformans]|uniref:TIR protein n=1 Tax=Gallionella capsiferriformans (strain ES-2) TaxID=395494 RepID=D9SG78_GALCS|nr:toll/interleukin-1 receptor domain-containing protein [Gallionella capsiferriformans]ADL55525.1 TIR protein [Gallionella capsiferriformans ES-2]